MRTYARIEGCTVAEIIGTDIGIESLYHPNISWVDVTDLAGVAEGWCRSDGMLQPPQLKAPTAPVVVASLEDIRSRIDTLHAEIASLTARADN